MKSIRRFFGVAASLAILLSLQSCAHGQRTKNHQRQAIETRLNDTAVVSEASVGERKPLLPEEQPEDVIERAIGDSNNAMSEMDDREAAPLHIPAEINERVEYWIHFFTVRERERTLRFLERGLALKPHIDRILKDNDMPTELFYLAMIESGFVQTAKSSASAVGVWQFMRGTGKNYGLAVDAYQDERRNWIKATEAAAGYLKDLNNVFGSWYLALASYNAGEYRIIRTIMRGKTRDFWALAEAKLLPKETLNYVPKFLAAMIVGKNLDRYGLKVSVDEVWEDYEVVSVPARVSLEAIARTTGVPLFELQKWNRDLIRGVTPHSRTGYVDIYVPQRLSSRIADAQGELRRLKPVVIASTKPNKPRGGSFSYYVVRSGDNVTSIARQLGVSTRTLMKINGMRYSKIHVGQRLKYIAGGESGRALATERKVARQVHKVRAGESLDSIAKRYNVRVASLIKLNSIKSREEIYVGQKLVVR